jgi:hypothetical protein
MEHARPAIVAAADRPLSFRLLSKRVSGEKRGLDETSGLVRRQQL